MATQFYADRGYVFINGREMANLKSVKWNIEEGIQRVDCMTRNKRSSGWKKGNKKISGSLELLVVDKESQIDLSQLYDSGNDIQIQCQLGVGGDRFLLSGFVQMSQDMSASVGEATKSINFECIDATNEGGSAVNSIIGF